MNAQKSFGRNNTKANSWNHNHCSSVELSKNLIAMPVTCVPTYVLGPHIIPVVCDVPVAVNLSGHYDMDCRKPLPTTRVSLYKRVAAHTGIEPVHRP